MQNYEQVKVLGEGGFGKAILARQKSDRRMCVIKEVRLSSLKQKDREEALKEAKVLASLKHPNIVQYITSFQERGCFYIVMEYADGGDLSQKIEKRRNKLFTEEEILHDFIQICLAIKYIHDRKILHRDLKTQNIFLTKEGEVKLGDFGIASVLEHTFQLCRTQIGTPYYLSPEICEGRSYNAKTDIWSLGCILYELCTLQHAFQGQNMKGLMMNICRGKVNPINRMYSNDLKFIIKSMLTTDPKKRPTINQILALPFIKSRLNNLLDKTILDYEFSHTVLHGRKPLAAPTVVLSKNKEPHNLIDDYEEDRKDNRNNNSRDDKQARPSSVQKQKEPSPSRENRSPSRQRQIQQMQQQRQNLPTGADPRYYQRQQRAQAAIPDNVDPRYARRQQQQQQKIEEEARRKEANERERQRLRQAEEQRRQKQKMKEKEEEERRIQKQEEIERERRRLEEQKRQDEEKRKRQQQQQALQERRKRLQEDLEKKKEEERLRKRIEADEARRRSEEEERERQREQLKMKQDMREQQRKRREEEEADIKRRDDERKRQRLIEQQREKDELEAEKAQLMEEEKQKKLAAARRQRELREEQKRQLEEEKKRKQQQQEEIMKDNGYIDFQGDKDQQNLNQQRRRQQPNRRIAPSFSEDEIPAKRLKQRPKWVDPEGRSYNDDDEDENKDLSEPPPLPPNRQRKPTWANAKNDDDDDGRYNRQPQQQQQPQRKQKPAWVSPTDNDYDNQQQQPQRKQKPAWVSPTDNDYDNQYNQQQQQQQQQMPPRKKKPAWVPPVDDGYNQPQQDDDNEAIEEPAWAKMPPKKMSILKKPKQKKFDDMSQEERNEYMRQLRHEAQANKQKASKIEGEGGDQPKEAQNDRQQGRPQMIKNPPQSPSPPQQQEQQPQRQNLMNKKFDDMTQEERNEYMRQLRHEAQANRQKANKIELEEGDDGQDLQNVGNERKSSPPVQRNQPQPQQQPQQQRQNLMNKKFDDMTQEERNEYMRQLRHEAQANRQKTNKIQLEEGDDGQDLQNLENPRRSSPPVQQQRPQPEQQQQPPKQNVMNKKFDDMTQEERNEYMRQLRHEAQANRQKANKIQLEEGEDEPNIPNADNLRRSSPPVQQQRPQPEPQQPPKQNIMNKKFDDMTQEERNEYMRQLRHEAQANRQKANKIQLEEGEDEPNIPNADNPRRSSPPVQQQRPQPEQQPPRQNIMNKKFDDMTQEERNEYMRQLRHEAQANRQKANRIQLEEGDDQQEIQNNPRKSSPPVQQQQQPPRQNIMNKKFDDMTQEERNEYMRQLRHEAQANRQKANRIQLEEGEDEPDAPKVDNPRRSSPPVQQQRSQPEQQPPPRQNIMSKKFDDMTQEERNEYMRQLRHEAQANRQKANRIQLEEGDDQNQYNNGNEQRQPRQSQPEPQQQPRQNIMNKKFDDMTQEERNEYMRQLRHEAQANRQKANRIQLEEGDDQNQYNNNGNARPSAQPARHQNLNNKRFEDMTVEERNEYARQLRHEAAENRKRALQNNADEPNNNNNYGGDYADIKDERIAKHEISEEDRRRIYEEQRAAFKAYRSRGRMLDNGAEAREALEDPDYVNQPPPKDERIAKHEISEEDRRRIYEEQRAAFKAYRNRGRLLDKGADVREAIEDPDYVNQPPPKDERIAKHEISEEDRRRIYEEQRAAFKAYRSRGRDIDKGAEVREAIEDPDYVNQPPPKDDRIAKHEISEEDRRRIYEEQRAAFKAYRSRGREIDNGAEAREALEDPDYVNQPPPKDDRIAKHQISEEDRRRIYEEQRAAFKAYKNRGRVVDSFVEEPSFAAPNVQEKKKPKNGGSNNNNNGRPSNDLYYIDDDDTEGYNFNSNLYYKKNKNGNNPSGVAKAAMFSPDFEDDEYDNTPQWAKNPSRHIPVNNNNNNVRQKQSLAQQEPAPGSPRFYDAVNDDEDESVDDNVKVFSPQINNVKKAAPAIVGNKRMIQLDNIIDNDNENDNFGDDDYNDGGDFNNEEISKAEKNVERLQRYAFSLKEALNLPEGNGTNFEDNNDDDDDGFGYDYGKENQNQNQIFYIQDKQLSLPVASDEESKNNRISTMRNYLEKQIGLQKLIELNKELINKAQNDSTPTPVINDLPPGLVCLAEQLLVLDGQNQNNDV